MGTILVAKPAVVILGILFFGLSSIFHYLPNKDSEKFYTNLIIENQKIPVVIYVEGKGNEERLIVTYKQNNTGGISEFKIDKKGRTDDPVVNDLIQEIKKLVDESKRRSGVKKEFDIPGRIRDFVLKNWKR